MNHREEIEEEIEIEEEREIKKEREKELTLEERVEILEKEGTKMKNIIKKLKNDKIRGKIKSDSDIINELGGFV